MAIHGTSGFFHPEEDGSCSGGPLAASRSRVREPQTAARRSTGCDPAAGCPHDAGGRFRGRGNGYPHSNRVQ